MRAARGRNSMNGGNYGRPMFALPFVLHSTFDPHLNFNQHQSQPHTHDEDPELTADLTLKSQNLSPKEEELKLCQAFMTKVLGVLDRMKNEPPGFNPGESFLIRQTGSYRKGTILAGHKTIDLILQLKGVPSTASLQICGEKISEDLKKVDKHSTYAVSVESLTLIITAEKDGQTLVARCSFTAVPYVFRKTDNLENRQELLRNFAAIEQARWFEENANSPAIRPLIRILKDMRNRFDGLKPLTPWMIDVLSCYAITNVERVPLTLANGFKRVFQLLAAGIFTPGSDGILEPCEPCARLHDPLTLKEQDNVCRTAQNLCRHLLHGNHKSLLGFPDSIASIDSENCILNGLVIVPTGAVYESSSINESEGFDDDLEGGGDWDQDDTSMMQT